MYRVAPCPFRCGNPFRLGCRRASPAKLCQIGNSVGGPAKHRLNRTEVCFAGCPDNAAQESAPAEPVREINARHFAEADQVDFPVLLRLDYPRLREQVFDKCACRVPRRALHGKMLGSEPWVEIHFADRPILFSR